MTSRDCYRLATGFILAVGTLVSAACATTTIDHVLTDPFRYRNREVRLAGSVVDSYSIANRGVYTIDDGTARLRIVSNRGTPRKDARVSVRGTIREGFTLGTLGGLIPFPAGLGSGLVMVESSRKVADR